MWGCIAYREPTWNYQVIRFLDADGRDMIPRKDRAWTAESATERMIAALLAVDRAVPDYLWALGENPLERHDFRALRQRSPMNCRRRPGGNMPLTIHRPRQAIGVIYIALYGAIFLGYVFFMEHDGSWMAAPKFTAAVSIWFLLSLAVKVSMVTNRSAELLNVVAVMAFLAIGFAYHPNPDNPNSIQRFCYYLYCIGGSACDVFDFIYEGAAKRPEGMLAGREK